MILEKKVQYLGNKVINALGQRLGDTRVETLISTFPEKPIIDEEPLLHDGSDMIDYTFHESGVSLGFDLSKKLEYVYFYLLERDNFQACTLNILPKISKETIKGEILRIFGTPNWGRKEKIPALALFGMENNDWFLYDKGTYRLRFEFNDETNKLQKINFMLAGTVPGYDIK